MFLFFSVSLCCSLYVCVVVVLCVSVSFLFSVCLCCGCSLCVCVVVLCMSVLWLFFVCFFGPLDVFVPPLLLFSVCLCESLNVSLSKVSRSCVQVWICLVILHLFSYLVLQIVLLPFFFQKNL